MNVLSTIDDFLLDRVFQTIVDFALDGFDVDRYNLALGILVVSGAAVIAQLFVVKHAQTNIVVNIVGFMAIIFAMVVVFSFRYIDGGKRSGTLPVARAALRMARTMLMLSMPVMAMPSLDGHSWILLWALNGTSVVAFCAPFWVISCRENSPDSVVFAGAS